MCTCVRFVRSAMAPAIAAQNAMIVRVCKTLDDSACVYVIFYNAYMCVCVCVRCLDSVTVYVFLYLFFF